MGVLDSAVDPVIARGISRRPGVTLAWTNRPALSTNLIAITTASTITGWGFYAGTPGASFDRIQIPLQSNYAGYLPTTALIRIRHTNSAGAILAEVQAPIVCVIGVDCWVEFSLPATITTAQPIWIEVFTNGRIQFYNVTTSGNVALFPSGTYPTTGYSTGVNTQSPASLVNYPTQICALFYASMADGSHTTVGLSPEFSGAIANQSFINRIATIQPSLIETASVGTRSGTYNTNSSTFSGWGCYIGNQTTPFNGVNFLVWPFDASALPTLATVRVRRMPADSGTWGSTNPATWDVIAECRLLPLSLSLNIWGDVVFPLNKSVSGHVWVEIQTNGRLGLATTTGGTGSPTIASPPISTYITGSSIIPVANWTALSTHQTFFVRVGNCDYNGGKLVVGSEIAAQISSSASSGNPTAYVALPVNALNILPALEGRELNVYFDNVIWSTVPLDQLCIDVTCTKGTQWAKCWRYTPTSGDAGSTTITVSVYTKDRASLLAAAAATLKTVSLSNPSTPVTRKILMIGDSTMSNGIVAAELFNLFSGDSTYTLTQVGSNSGSVNDSGSVSRSVNTDAIAGWTFNLFTTDTTTAWTQLSGASRTGSPFCFSGAFNFASYLSAQSITMASSDWVIINLGINDVFSYTDDTAAGTQVSTVIAQLATWVTSIKASVSGVRIGICLTIPPSYSQDAFGYNYGSGQTRARYIRNIKLLRDAVIAAYDTATVSNVFVIPYHVNLDTENNMTTGSVAVNARNSTTYTQQQNGVHPANSGYYQLADTLRSFLKNKE